MINKLLIIDDDSGFNLISEYFLIKSGRVRELEFFLSAQKAIDHLCSLDVKDYPDLILLDLNMPVMDGFEFLESIDSITGFNPDTKIVILSTSGRTKDLQRARTYDKVIDYFEKPLTEEKLEKLVAYAQYKF